MDLNRRRFCIAAAATLVASRAWSNPSAWPQKPLRLVVPGGTGGVADVRARWLAPRLAALAGQPVVVENRPGAGGLVAMEAIARETDEHTIMVVHQGVMAANPAMYAKLPYDPLRDFIPLTPMGIGDLALVVPPRVEATTVQELVRWARGRREPLTYSSPGIGTPPHLAAELFRREAGIQALHVPYKGGGQAATDLMGGHIDFSIEGLSVAAPLVQAGKLRALATTGPERVPSMRGVPTLRESGLPGSTFRGWIGLAMPAATSRAVVARVHAMAAQVLSSAESREYFAAAGAEPGVLDPDAFTAFIRDEQTRIGRIVREAGIRAE